MFNGLLNFLGAGTCALLLYAIIEYARKYIAAKEEIIEKKIDLHDIVIKVNDSHGDDIEKSWEETEKESNGKWSEING